MGCPIRPSNVRVYQFHHFGTKEALTGQGFFCGEVDGDATGCAVGDTTGEAVTEGTAAAALAAGDGNGKGAAGRSLTTDEGLLIPGRANTSARNMKIAAEITVAFSSGFCSPRGPKAV